MYAKNFAVSYLANLVIENENNFFQISYDPINLSSSSSTI